MAKKIINVETSTPTPTPEAPLTLTFPVQSFRKLNSPYKDGETDNPTIYFAVCDVKSLPENIPMDTNPRERNLNTHVAKKIRDSLLGGNNNFHLLNRGILLSADSVTYNNYSNTVTVVFTNSIDESSHEILKVHGNVDGGHTYSIILKERDKLEFGKQYVTLEILTGVENIFEDLAAARNTSVQVQDKSIAELENRFEIIKKALEGYINEKRICFKENAPGDIDVSEILSILMMFNIKRFPDRENCPTIAYNSRKRCIDLYIQDHETFGESIENPYVKMSKIMPKIFQLYDEIETKMEEFYCAKFQGGKYKRVKGVVSPPEGKKFKSKFFEKKLDAQSPNGFIYPILGAFRALVEEGSDGYYHWKSEPSDILNKVGQELVESTVSMSRALGNNPPSTGKNPNLWKTLYMTVAFEVMS